MTENRVKALRLMSMQIARTMTKTEREIQKITLPSLD